MGDSARVQGLATWDVDSGHAMSVHAWTPGGSVTLPLGGSTVATAVTAARCSLLVQAATASRY
jgi:hypothetical protein